MGSCVVRPFFMSHTQSAKTIHTQQQQQKGTTPKSNTNRNNGDETKVLPPKKSLEKMFSSSLFVSSHHNKRIIIITNRRVGSYSLFRGPRSRTSNSTISTYCSSWFAQQPQPQQQRPSSTPIASSLRSITDCRRRFAGTKTGGGGGGTNKKQAMQRQLKHGNTTTPTEETNGKGNNSSSSNNNNNNNNKRRSSSSSISEPPTLSVTENSPPPSSLFGSTTSSTLKLQQPQSMIQLEWNNPSSTTHPPSFFKNHDRNVWEPDPLLSDLSTISNNHQNNNNNNNNNNNETVTFEREAMFDPLIHLPYAPKDWKGYEEATPLSDYLMQRIGVSGHPITIAEFMRHALTHPLYGYYTNPPSSSTLEKSLLLDESQDWDADDGDKLEDRNHNNHQESTIFGRRGDFITAPEVSHVFGHCICVWLMTQWQTTLRKSNKVQLVELGPGRGTLMNDILSLATTSKLIEFGRSIHEVHLIEASPELRIQQQESLQTGLGHLVDFDFCTTFDSNNMNDENNDHDNKKKTESSTSTSKDDEDDGDDDAANKSDKIEIRVQWHDDFTSFQHRRDKDIPAMMVLQEFLDALPIHVFQKTAEGWRERLIDVVSVEEEDDDDNIDNSGALIPRLRQVLAPDTTPAVDLFLSSEAYHNVPVDSVVEVCPEALLLVQDMTKVIEESQGVALIIDYGQDGTSDTLRAFSKHRQVPLTSYPGQVDVTADVDFYALKTCLPTQSLKAGDDENKIHAFGPVTQGEFLMRMGAGDMVIHSIEKEDTSEEEAQKLSDALKYLVLPENMGDRYKVLALGRKREGIFSPPGMEVGNLK